MGLIDWEVVLILLKLLLLRDFSGVFQFVRGLIGSFAFLPTFLAQRVMTYVKQHLSKHLTLQEIAEELQISRNYLGKIFRDVVGLSFKDYVKQERMRQALKMLREGDYFIYEISEKVGYVNPTYFSTCFKEYTGMSPTELIYKS